MDFKKCEYNIGMNDIVSTFLGKKRRESSICPTSKKVHETEQHAVDFLSGEKKKRKNMMRIYKCDRCSGWHLTKLKSEQYVSKQRKKEAKRRLIRGIKKLLRDDQNSFQASH